MTWLLERHSYESIKENFLYSKKVDWKLVDKTDSYLLIYLDEKIRIEFIEDKWEIVWIDVEEYISKIPFEAFKEYFMKNIFKKLI